MKDYGFAKLSKYVKHDVDGVIVTSKGGSVRVTPDYD